MTLAQQTKLEKEVSLDLNHLNEILKREINDNKKNYQGLIKSLWNLRNYDEHTRAALKSNIHNYREYINNCYSYLNKSENQIRFLKVFKEVV